MSVALWSICKKSDVVQIGGIVVIVTRRVTPAL
jgi:hypothetical protein